MENAINPRAAGIFLAGAAGMLHAPSFAGVEVGEVAMQDLTLKSMTLKSIIFESFSTARGSQVIQ